MSYNILLEDAFTGSLSPSLQRSGITESWTWVVTHVDLWNDCFVSIAATEKIAIALAESLISFSGGCATITRRIA
tara:strand:+ start:1014 stop:1238 length:225 start_codon:yes stop_codon:yes gene_type:complete